MERAQIIELTRHFLGAFNRNDLDAVMSFSPTTPSTTSSMASAALARRPTRAAFAPQFNGAYGKMQFLDEDLFADAGTGKVMASWRCSLMVKGEPTSWRGLDLLHFGRRQSSSEADLREGESSPVQSVQRLARQLVGVFSTS